MGVCIFGIDSVRFVAALMVFIFHGGGPQLSGIWSDTRVEQVYVSSFNGVAAVLVFFIVSGFCIHFPHVNKPTLSTCQFYLKRFIRIGLPLFALSLVLYLADVAHGGSWDGKFWYGTYFYGLTTVVWSLIAEVSYYAAYPVIFYWARILGIGTLLVGSIAVSLVLMSFDSGGKTIFPLYSIPVMCLVGLPFWLTGCLLAEKGIPKIKSRGGLAASRCATFGYLFIVQYLYKFNNLTLQEPLVYLPFAPIVYWWLKNELIVGNEHSVSWLEWGGRWSYSLYLTHKPLMTCYEGLLLMLGINGIFFLKIVFVLVGAFIFACSVEWPAQRLAGLSALAWQRKIVVRPRA